MTIPEKPKYYIKVGSARILNYMGLLTWCTVYICMFGYRIADPMNLLHVTAALLLIGYTATTPLVSSEPSTVKPNTRYVCKTLPQAQIIRTVRSESSLSSLGSFRSLATHKAPSKVWSDRKHGHAYLFQFNIVFLLIPMYPICLQIRICWECCLVALPKAYKYRNKIFFMIFIQMQFSYFVASL